MPGCGVATWVSSRPSKAVPSRPNRTRANSSAPSRAGLGGPRRGLAPPTRRPSDSHAVPRCLTPSVDQTPMRCRGRYLDLGPDIRPCAFADAPAVGQPVDDEPPPISKRVGRDYVMVGRRLNRWRDGPPRLQANCILAQLNGESDGLAVETRRLAGDLGDQLARQKATAAARALLQAVEQCLDLAGGRLHAARRRNAQAVCDPLIPVPVRGNRRASRDVALKGPVACLISSGARTVAPAGRPSVVRQEFVPPARPFPRPDGRGPFHIECRPATRTDSLWTRHRGAVGLSTDYPDHRRPETGPGPPSRSSSGFQT